MHTIINLFVKKFQPDPSNTVWLVCNYVATTHVANQLVGWSLEYPYFHFFRLSVCMLDSLYMLDIPYCRVFRLSVCVCVCVCNARLHSTNQRTDFDKTFTTCAICAGNVRVWISLPSNHLLLCSGRKTACSIFNTCPSVLNVEKRDFGIKHFEIFRKFYSSRFLIEVLFFKW